MPQGTISRLITDRGFGFIAGERGEVFFHHSAVQGTSFDNLKEGQAVEYEIDQSPQSDRGKKGPRAALVKPV
jgi:CspA family cold shock protein